MAPFSETLYLSGFSEHRNRAWHDEYRTYTLAEMIYLNQFATLVKSRVVDGRRVGFSIAKTDPESPDYSTFINDIETSRLKLKISAEGLMTLNIQAKEVQN